MEEKAKHIIPEITTPDENAPKLDNERLMKFLKLREYTDKENRNIVSLGRYIWRGNDESWENTVTVNQETNQFITIEIYGSSCMKFKADYQTDAGISEFDEIADWCPMDVELDGDYVQTAQLLKFAEECFDLCKDLLNWHFLATRQPCRVA